MDNLTHTLIGVHLSEAGLSRRFGRGTLLTLVVASNLPDIDIVTMLFGDEFGILSRRMLTHSLFGIPLLAAAAALILRIWIKNIPWRHLFGLCLLGLGVHVFFDLVNSFGVLLLYPLSSQRFELAWMFIIDPFLWGLLLSAAWLAWLRLKKFPRERVFRWGLAAAALYVALCGIGRMRGAAQLQKLAGAEGLTPDFSYVFPEPLGPHRFRGVLRQGDAYRLYLMNVWTGESELMRTITTEADHPLIQKVRKTQAAKNLEWFFKAPVWKILPGDETQVKIFDLRFMSLVFPGRPLPFAFKLHASAP